MPPRTSPTSLASFDQLAGARLSASRTMCSASSAGSCPAQPTVRRIDIADIYRYGFDIGRKGGVKRPR